MKKIILATIFATFTPLCFAQESQVEPKLPEDSHVGVESAPHMVGEPIEVAKGEKLSKAAGYFGRARSLLLAAVEEFDKGVALVDPSALLDIPTWRSGVTTRIDELGRVLDPQPRVSKGGARYEPQQKLLGRKPKK